MNAHALRRVLLGLGLLVFLIGMVMARRVHTEARGMEVVLIGLIAAGAFLLIVGLIGVLTEQPEPEEDVERLPVHEGKPASVGAAVGAYLLALALITGIIVGVATGDTGAGIQAFSFGAILGGIVFGLGYVLGLRPGDEEGV